MENLQYYKDKLNYWKTVFLSWWKDMHSFEKIINKGWDKHIPISIIFVIAFALLLKYKLFLMDLAFEALN